MSIKLFDKIYGCIAGSWIASAMGRLVEGWSIAEIKEEYGVLDKLVTFHQKGYTGRFPGGGYYDLKEAVLPPGTTEDGIERQKLLSTAIIEKKGRITIEDLAEIWIRDINPDKFGYLFQEHDRFYYDLLKGGLPADDAGSYSLWPGLVTMARSAAPIGIVNACNPQQAAWDAKNVGKMLQPVIGYGLDGASAVTAAIAEALKADSTIDSVVEASLKYIEDTPFKDILLETIEMAKKHDGPLDLRYSLNDKFEGAGLASGVEEIVSKGISIFYITAGDPKASIIGGVNLGRDTDCPAAIASSIAGVFTGIKGIPQEWVEIVEKATIDCKYTLTNRTIEETANGLYEAVLNNRKIIKDQLNYLDQLLEE